MTAHIAGSFHPAFEGLPWLRGSNVSFPPPSLDLESPSFLFLAFVYIEEMMEARLVQCW